MSLFRNMLLEKLQQILCLTLSLEKCCAKKMSTCFIIIPGSLLSIRQELLTVAAVAPWIFFFQGVSAKVRFSHLHNWDRDSKIPCIQQNENFTSFDFALISSSIFRPFLLFFIYLFILNIRILMSLTMRPPNNHSSIWRKKLRKRVLVNNAGCIPGCKLTTRLPQKLLYLDKKNLHIHRKFKLEQWVTILNS